MARFNILFGLVLFLSLSTKNVFCEYDWSITESLADGKYLLTRSIDLSKSVIRFHVIVETTGYIGLGLSPNGGMKGADIFMGGVLPQGDIYYSDYHSADNNYPIEDDSPSHWMVEETKENRTHTEMIFSRIFDTCDAQDVAITEDTLSIIWAYGDYDEINYHKQNKGTLQVNLLDPPMPSSDMTQYSSWNVIVDDTMPSEDTSYLCSIHQAPQISKAHHIVGFDALLKSKEAVRHTHHFNFWKCTVLPGFEDKFAHAVNDPAFDCAAFIPHPLYIYCQKHLHVWAKGGHRTTFPDHVGLPLLERPGASKEYYMLEIHYDNPTRLQNLRFETGLTVYHTKDLRKYTAGVLVIGHQVHFAHTIPPMSRNFLTVGHCSSECTKESIPDDGINVFNILLHSHLSGRKLKLRQFRNNIELPWFSYDDNYDFNFQQNRPLKHEKKILKGDHLVYECTTDTTWKEDKSVTVGYLSTRDEMCETFLLYYPKMEMDYCASTYPIPNLLEDFQFENFNGLETNENRNDPIITGPENIRGRNYTDILTNYVQWTPELRNDFQTKIIQNDHNSFCAISRNAGLEIKGTTNYPNIKTYYRPQNTCENKNSGSEDVRSSFLFLTASCLPLILSLKIIHFL